MAELSVAARKQLNHPPKMTKDERERILAKGRNIRHRHGVGSAEYKEFFDSLGGKVAMIKPTYVSPIVIDENQTVCERTQYRHAVKLRKLLETVPVDCRAFAISKAVEKDQELRHKLAKEGAMFGTDAEVARVVLQEIKGFSAGNKTVRTRDTNAARNAVAAVVAPGDTTRRVPLKKIGQATGLTYRMLKRGEERKGQVLLGGTVTWCLLQRKVQRNKLHPGVSHLIRTFYDMPENTRADPRSGEYAFNAFTCSRAEILHRRRTACTQGVRRDWKALQALARENSDRAISRLPEMDQAGQPGAIPPRLEGRPA